MKPIGRTLPHSLEAEEQLLACCLLDGADVLARCVESHVEADSFYEPKHGIVFTHLLALYDREAVPIDASIVAEELKRSRQLEVIGGYAFIAQISSRTPTTAQATYFIEKVRELALLRRLIRVCDSASESCREFTGDIGAFVDGVETKLFAVTQNRVSDAAKQVKGPAEEAMGLIRQMTEKRGALTGVSSGFIDIDKLLWGFQKKDMIVLAARPSGGKTALALNFAEAAALPKRDAPASTVLIFSLEMGSSQLAMRLLCSRARVNMALLRDGLISRNGGEQERLDKANAEISKSPILIDDSSSLTAMEIRAKARRVHARTPLGLIIVDYLQLLSPSDPSVNREQQVSEASRSLKALAKELDVPVIVLSQLNRSSEKENRAPRLSDLRESGAIEQDADVVLMLSRPKEADEKFQVAADTADLIVAKQRNGPVGEVKLTFLRDITRFENFHR